MIVDYIKKLFIGNVADDNTVDSEDTVSPYDVRYCGEDGTELQDVLREEGYDMFTGERMTTTSKQCPLCKRVPVQGMFGMWSMVRLPRTKTKKHKPVKPSTNAGTPLPIK